jgi:alpha 1,2-mannosyltransferase
MSKKEVITLAGGKYLAGAAVQVMELRHLGCDWPYTLFTLPHDEFPDGYRKLFGLLGVTVRLIKDLGHPWTAKRLAIQQFPDTDVLFLDADNIPLINPEIIRSDRRYQESGSVFWRDQNIMSKDHPVYAKCGVEPREEFEMESGQLLINTRKCAAGLEQVGIMDETWWEYYSMIHGDKEQMRLSWNKVGLPVEWGSREIEVLRDDHGNQMALIQRWGDIPAFHHRSCCKMKIEGDNWWRVGQPLRWFEHLETVRRVVQE